MKILRVGLRKVTFCLQKINHISKLKYLRQLKDWNNILPEIIYANIL